MDSRTVESLEQVNERLKEIIQLVHDDSIPLDQALDLFDEAARMGLQATRMLEDDSIIGNENDSQAPVS